jgi:hypothetical protein
VNVTYNLQNNLLCLDQAVCLYEAIQQAHVGFSTILIKSFSYYFRDITTFALVRWQGFPGFWAVLI